MQFSVDKANAGIFLINKAGDIIYTNDIQCKRLGYTKEELLKLKIGDVGMAAKNWDEVFNIIKEKHTHIMYTEHRRKDGSFFPVEVTANYFEFEGQGYSFGFAVDITERKKSEEALKNSENMYRKLVMTLPDAVLVTDEDIKITFASPKAVEIHGYENSDELIGKKIEELVVPEDRKNRNEIRKIISGNGFINNLQYRLLRKNGKIFIGETNVTVLKDDNGNFKGFLWLTRDITRRVEMENDIRESEKRYKRIVDNVIDGLIIIGDKKVNYVSERAVEILGYTLENIKDMREIDIAAPEEKERVLNEIKKSIDETQVLPKNLEYWIVRGDDTRRCISSRYSPRFENGKIVDYYVFIADITERKVAEENLRNLLSRLQKSNEELERFAVIASHDLKEPLRMVTSYVQLIEKRYKGKLDKDADDFINFAVEGVKRMAGLIDDLLAYSKVDSVVGKPDKIDINNVISGVINNLKIAIEESKSKIIYDKLPEVTANEVQMSQVFQNLIGNSIKFRGKEPPEIEIKAEKDKNEWVFSIKDNGIGIDMKYKDKIFVIFQRLHTRTEYPGTGIGLVLCKKIVEKHGGRIWFESEPGKGSIFYFTIPYKIAESKA